MGDNTKYGPGREFVRSMPDHLTAQQIADAATDTGLPMTRKQAQQWRYLIRKEKLKPAKANLKLKLKRNAAAAATQADATPTVAPAVMTVGRNIPGRMPTNSKEAQLRLLIFELGYDTVALCLEEYRRWVKED